MRPLRWKGRFQTGDAQIDRRNRGFVDCLNGLISAAGQREHCHEMEEFMAGFVGDAEEILKGGPKDRDLAGEFGARLRSSLPLPPFGSPACRKCGLCDIAQEKIAEHLDAPTQCLFVPKSK